MKKLLLMLLCFSTGAPIFGIGYTIKINNQTIGEIKAYISYRACSDDQVLIPSVDSRELNVKFCCTKWIDFTATEVSGQKVRYTPPSNVGGISCRGFEVNVKQAADGSLVPETV